MRRAFLLMIAFVLLPLVSAAQGRITPSRTTLPFLTLTGDLTMGSGTQIVFNGGSTLDGNTTDVIEQRNGSNAQIWRLFETFTDSSNNQGYQCDAGVTTANTVTCTPFENGTGADSQNLALSALGAAGEIIFASSDLLRFREGSHSYLVLTGSVNASAADRISFSSPSGHTATSGTQTAYSFADTFSPASGTPRGIGFAIKPTINWGGTPGAGNYEALFIDVTETAIPTGENYLIRAQVDAGDIFGVTSLGGIRGRHVVEAVTDTKTTTAAESGETYTNTGDADGTTFTLLNDPAIGVHWRFVATVAQTMTIVASSGETIESSGATCGTSITLTDGQSVTLEAATAGSGAQYHVTAGVGFTCNA